MSRSRGRCVALSPARRLITDLMRACRNVPTVTAERRMDLSALVAARRAIPVRPMWTAILTKAFALVSAAEPVLRQSYIGFPWAHLYEHAEPVASVTVEREHEGERVVFIARLAHPHTRPLAELDAELRRAKDAPPHEVAGFRRSLRIARLPGPLRRFALWLALHASGRWRGRHAGTFGLSSPAADGGGLLRLLTPLSVTLHSGLFDDAGRLDLRLTFDHRVMDGATAARALVATERALRGPVLTELQSMVALPTTTTGIVAA